MPGSTRLKPTLLIALALAAAAPAFAHDEKADKSEKAEKKEPAGHHDVGEHAKGAEHSDAPRSFSSRPEVGTWAKCPVSGDVFKVGKDTRFVTHEGRVYAMCCAECAPDFEKDPSKYADKK